MATDSPKLVVRVPTYLHRAAKVKAYLMGKTLESVVVSLLQDWVGPDLAAIDAVMMRLEGTRDTAKAQEAADESKLTRKRTKEKAT